MNRCAALRLLAPLLLGTAVDCAFAGTVIATVTQRDSKIEFNASAGDEVQILMPVQTGAGFHWRIREGSIVSGKWQLRRESLRNSVTTTGLGGSARQVFEVELVGTGRHILIFDLVGPPGSPDGVHPVKTVEIVLDAS